MDESRNIVVCFGLSVRLRPSSFLVPVPPGAAYMAAPFCFGAGWMALVQLDSMAVSKTVDVGSSPTCCA